MPGKGLDVCPNSAAANPSGIGSLEVRAFYESARHDRPGEWTCDDVAAAGRQANQTAHSMGLGGLAPELAWQGRTSIPEIEAQRFRKAYDHHSSSNRPHWLRASIDRLALSRALVERGYLPIRSSRVAPPITLQSGGRIS